MILIRRFSPYRHEWASIGYERAIKKETERHRLEIYRIEKRFLHNTIDWAKLTPNAASRWIAGESFKEIAAEVGIKNVQSIRDRVKSFLIRLMTDDEINDCADDLLKHMRTIGPELLMRHNREMGS